MDLDGDDDENDVAPTIRADDVGGDRDRLTEPLLIEELESLDRGVEDDDEAPLSSSSPSSSSCPRRCSRLTFFKVLYFLGGLNGAAWGRFGVVYYNRVEGLSADRVGVLRGVSPLVGLLASPVWGVAADSVRSRKRVYLLCQTCSTVALLAIPLLADGEFGKTLACVVAMSAFRSSGVLDAHVLDHLGDARRDRYGSVRLWAAVSWGGGAMIMGWIADSYGFRWNFVVFGVMRAAVLAVTAIGLPARSRDEQRLYDRSNDERNNGDDHEHQHDDWRERVAATTRTLCEPPVLFWLFEVLVIGAGMSMVDSFLFVYLQNDLGASTRLCGCTVGVTVLFEIPIFLRSKRLLRDAGHDALFVVAALAYAARVTGYTVLTTDTVRWVLLLEVLHGVTFACAWTAFVDFAARAAPPGSSTTFQTVLSATMDCLGGGVGPIVGGAAMERLGAARVYRFCGAVVLAVTIVHTVRWRALGRGHGSYLRSKSDDDDDDDERAREST